MNVVSCNCGLRNLTAILLEIGEARGEGVMTAGESPGCSDEAEIGDGGVIFLNPLDVKPGVLHVDFGDSVTSWDVGAGV